MGNDHSRSGETKKNTKTNKKKNKTNKKNQTAPAVADAPTVTVDCASSLQREAEKGSVPTIGRVGRSENGDLLFEVGAGSGRFLLCESGVTGPLADLDPIPADAAPPSPCEEELAAHRERWAEVARARELDWNDRKRRYEEEQAMRVRHGYTVEDW